MTLICFLDSDECEFAKMGVPAFLFLKFFAPVRIRSNLLLPDRRDSISEIRVIRGPKISVKTMATKSHEEAQKWVRQSLWLFAFFVSDSFSFFFP